MKIKNVKNKVTNILTHVPESRDNDMKLLAIVWNEECGGKDCTNNMSGFDFLCKLEDKVKDLGIIELYKNHRHSIVDKLLKEYNNVQGKS